MPQSTVLKGIEVVNDSISIPGYGADTFYPTEDRRGNLYSGFDDGGVGVGDREVGVNSARPTFTMFSTKRMRNIRLITGTMLRTALKIGFPDLVEQ